MEGDFCSSLLALNGTAHNNTENWTFPVYVVRLSLALIPLLATKKNGRSIKIDCPVFHFLKQKGFTLTYIVYFKSFSSPLRIFRKPLFNPLIALIITVILDWKFYERSLVNNHPRSQDYFHNYHRIKQRKKNRKVWILGNLFTINFSRKPKIAT